jgi:hypothetical protein
MTTKAKLCKLVGELSEAAARLKLWFTRRSALVALMESAPLDDEPFTEQDETALAESYDELAAGGQTMSVKEFALGVSSRTPGVLSGGGSSRASTWTRLAAGKGQLRVAGALLPSCT